VQGTASYFLEFRKLVSQYRISGRSTAPVTQDSVRHKNDCPLAIGRSGISTKGRYLQVILGEMMSPTARFLVYSVAIIATTEGGIVVGQRSQLAPAFGLCVPAGARTAKTSDWRPDLSPAIEFSAPTDACEVRFTIPKPSKFTVVMNRVDRVEDFPSYSLGIEKVLRGSSRSLSAVDFNGSNGPTYLAWEPGPYLARIRKDRLFGTQSKEVPMESVRLRLSMPMNEPLPERISSLEPTTAAVMHAAPSQDRQMLPFRITERGFVRLRFAPVCYADRLETQPPSYSLQRVDECRRFGLTPDGSGHVAPGFDVDVLDSRGRVRQPLWLRKAPSGTSDVVQQTQELGTVLPAGLYVLRVNRSFYGTLYSERQSGPLNVSVVVSQLQQEPVPPAAQALVRWLESTGLGEDFSVLDFYAVVPTAAIRCATDIDRLRQAVFFEAATRHDKSLERDPTRRQVSMTRVTDACDPNAKPVEVPTSEVPAVLVQLGTALNRFELEELEQKFDERFGTTLWDRMFLKVSSSTGVSQRRIVMHVPIYCSASLAYWEEGSASRRGSECQSVSTTTATFELPGLAAAPSATIRAGVRTPGALISASIENGYRSKGATVEFLEREDDIVEAIVRGLRGEVIRGGRDWERLQVSIVALREQNNTIRLRATIDGRLASGVGAYPADSVFTTDMEPRFSGALNDYARKLIAVVKADVTRSQQPR
jgi:hypothetical protein